MLYIITFVSIPTLSLYTACTETELHRRPRAGRWCSRGVRQVVVALADLGAVASSDHRRRPGRRAWRWASSAPGPSRGRCSSVAAACLLTVVTLRQAGVGPEGLVTGQALVGLYDRLFLLSGSTMPAFNALLLGPLLYWSRLVPRVLPIVGMIRAPLLLAGNAAVLFGVVGRTSPLALLLAIPIAVGSSH